MTDREFRLRERIDRLADERDRYKATVRELTALVSVLEQRLANALASHGVLIYPHGNQHGPAIRYVTDEERRMARRLTWRESKRRIRQGRPFLLASAADGPDERSIA